MLTRLRWQLQDLWDAWDARVIVGVLVLGVLVLGGFLAARAVAHASNSAATRPGVHVLTMREKVPVGEHGTQTALRTETIHTPTGVRLVTHRVTRYRVVYRKHVVRTHGETRTVLRPVTNTRTSTSTSSRLVTVTRQVTDTRTVTQPVTVVSTTTVVSTETQTVPITITVTLPITTG
ncbi:MAG: hypothetical protein ACJ75G_06330 [Gaiellaceae bacterium]